MSEFLADSKQSENHHHDNDVHDKECNSKTNGQIGKITCWVWSNPGRVEVSSGKGVSNLKKIQKSQHWCKLNWSWTVWKSRHGWHTTCCAMQHTKHVFLFCQKSPKTMILGYTIYIYWPEYKYLSSDRKYISYTCVTSQGKIRVYNT